MYTEYLRPVCTSTLMHIQSTFKPVLSHPHYMHDFIAELNVYSIQSTYRGGSEVDRIRISAIIGVACRVLSNGSWMVRRGDESSRRYLERSRGAASSRWGG